MKLLTEQRRQELNTLGLVTKQSEKLIRLGTRIIVTQQNCIPGKQKRESAGSISYFALQNVLESTTADIKKHEPSLILNYYYVNFNIYIKMYLIYFMRNLYIIYA